ncbi:MAG: 30S ribosomal protein S8 [Bacteroidota bacterium]|nr:30S ribosomal protein S8 [Bacteroidota bacterium]
MNTTDPISDYLTRIRNSIRAHHKRVDIPASYLKREITKLLVEQKFIAGFTEINDMKQGIIRINLRYNDGISAITGITRVSKPGRRAYKTVNDIPRVLNGLGIAIISTSKGIMTDKDAKQQNVGGEILCNVW